MEHLREWILPLKQPYPQGEIGIPSYHFEIDITFVNIAMKGHGAHGWADRSVGGVSLNRDGLQPEKPFTSIIWISKGG